MERTLVIIKPDGVRRGLIGEIISRYEKKGLKISNIRMIHADEEILKKHYAEHQGKSFYKDLLDFMMSGRIVVMVVEGKNVVETVRKINGKTNPLEAEMGSIRGDFANFVTENIVHGSDSAESAEREISIWF
ncbi:MAG: nucleoside-diphosphate kinase [Clostridiales bacterium]|nr:nucleoside-diphosphate kinase [Clostridiales bacterium]